MQSAITVVAVLVLAQFLPGQDLKLREEAIRLLEHANAVSSSPKLPNLERVDNFRAFLDSGTAEGAFTRVVIQGVGRREEYRLGDYDLVNVFANNQVAVSGSSHILPPDLLDVVRITPIYLVRFDGQDVIHAITERMVSGHVAQCTQFDSLHGDHTNSNELCVDASNGTLVYEKLGPEAIENSEFFAFAGALLPGRITYSLGGKKGSRSRRQ